MKAIIFLVAFLFMLVGSVAAQQVYMGGGNVIDVFEGQLKIKGGNPALNKVFTSDADGLATWTLPAGGGFTDAGTTVILTNINDKVGIGTSSPNAKLDVGGTPGTSVGGFPSGGFHVTNPSASVNANSVITGHNQNGGNKQLWYLGNTSSSNDDIGLLNRQNGTLHFSTNNTMRMMIRADGSIDLGDATNTVSTVKDVFAIVPRSTPPAAETGGFYVDSDLDLPCFYNGTNWVQMDDFTTVCS